MPAVLQITASANWGAIGRIANQIGETAIAHGWGSYIAYGRYCNPSLSKLIKVGSKHDVITHYMGGRLFDMDGLLSNNATKELVSAIEQLSPNLIHLHNIHDHWLNYEILFDYLNKLSIPIVWTQHDCWSFTGGCCHFTLNKCDKWKCNCSECFMRKGILPLVNKSQYHFNKKKELFNGLSNLTIVPVSSWLESLLKESFLNGNNIKMIYNGVDTGLFCPIVSSIKERLNIEGNYLLVALATAWSTQKGLNDYIAVSRILPDNIKLLLVGMTEKQQKKIPNDIFTIGKTQSIQELAEIYSGADIVLNLSYEETFGMTTAEGFACGTPGIVYNCTASPELISEETGEIVEAGDIAGVLAAVQRILKRGKEYYRSKCRKRACEMFDMNINYEKYLNLYESLLQHKQ